MYRLTVVFDGCDGCDSYDELADTVSVTSYIQFCEDTVIESRYVRIFSNKKPWFNKELKQVLTRKNIPMCQQ